VVGLSILAGVTIIPAQGAALFDALLERQRENNVGKANVAAAAAAATALREGDDDDDSTIVREQLRSDRMVLETAMPCPKCGAVMHWATAKYCWSCGSRLVFSVVESPPSPLTTKTISNERENDDIG